jgi:hypothetical protein
MPPQEIKKLMKHIHQISIKYLTYLVLNKRKLDNKHIPVDPSWNDNTHCIHLYYIREPTLRKEGTDFTLKLGKT